MQCHADFLNVMSTTSRVNVLQGTVIHCHARTLTVMHCHELPYTFMQGHAGSQTVMLGHVGIGSVCIYMQYWVAY